MEDHVPAEAESNLRKEKIFYDKGTIRVIIFACAVIVLAVVSTGLISYSITHSAVVEKLKSRDLVYIVQSITAKIDARIGRARETSLLLANDPVVIDWITGGETDPRLSVYATQRINTLAADYDYANAFITSAVSSQYWAEGSRVIQIMEPDDPYAQWFYDALKTPKAVQFNLDYNKGRQETFAFLNVLVGDVRQPIGVAGVGLNLHEIAQEFQTYKFGQKSNLWLIGSNEIIFLSDHEEDNGKRLSDFLPSAVFAQLEDNDAADAASGPKVIEYTDAQGNLMDLVYQREKSAGWKIVFQVPRSESIAILDMIKFNTLSAGLLTILLMIFVFYMVSHKIANPLQRAVRLTQEMEKQVTVRTRELAEKNREILDSIDYAQKIQESILPSAADVQKLLGDYFILWRPRDLVGGDCYWTYQSEDGRKLIAIVDCTGHGVPGALMTMTVNAELTHLAQEQRLNPPQILTELNRRVKAILHRNHSSRITDDGLDIALCEVQGDRLVFAGAKHSLYILREGRIERFKGDKISVGYRNSPDNPCFTPHVWEIHPGDRFYLTTDGYHDQNGGEKNYAFGRTRFTDLILLQREAAMNAQGEAFAQALEEYMGNEAQRDDITVIGFRLG